MDGEMINSDTIVPRTATFIFTAVSDDGVIQLDIPKEFSEYGEYIIEYTGTASLAGITYLQ